MRKLLPILSLILISSTVGAVGDPLKKMARDLGKSIRKLDKARVGILAFPYHDGKISSGSSIISERLTTHLVNVKGIRVIERRLISKILEEQRMLETGVIDPKTAKKMGNVLGVDVIVTGTLIEVSDTDTEVNARGLNTETGEIIVASHKTIRNTWKDRPRMPRPPYMEGDLSVSEKSEVPKVKRENEAIEVGYPPPRRRRGTRR